MEIVRAVQIGLPNPINRLQVTQTSTANIFSFSFRVDPTWFSSSYLAGWGLTNDIPSEPLIIVSVEVDNQSYIETDNLTELAAQPGGFFADDYILYIHFLSSGIDTYSDAFYSDSVTYVDRQWLHSDGTTTSEGNGLGFETRVAQTDDFSRQLDVKATGVFLYNSGAAVLQNHDAFFDRYMGRATNPDGVITNQLFGRPFRIYVGYDGDDFDDFTQEFTGTIDTYGKPNRSRFSIRGLDNRERLSKQLPINICTTTEFANLADEYNLKYKPLIIGEVKNGETIPTNTGPDTLPATIDYLFHDTELYACSSVEGVYADYSADNQGWVLLDPADYTVTLSTGIVSITKAAALVPGETNQATAIRVHAKAEATNLLPDVIEFVIDNFGGIEFSASTYVTSTWPVTGPTVGVNVTENNRKKLSQVLEELMKSTADYLTTDGQGRYEYIALSDTAIDTIDEAAIDGDWSVEDKSDEFISSVRIVYNQGEDAYLYTAEEETLELSYGRVNREQIETSLVTLSEVQALAAELVELRGVITPTITMRYFKARDLSLGQAVTWELPESLVDGVYKPWNVTGLDKINQNVTLRLRG